MILIGIDPGSRYCGYGILQIEKYQIYAAGHGVVSVKQSLSFEDKLLFLREEIKKVIDQYQPNYAAVEAIFFGKNIQTAFTLGHFRGVLVCTLRESGIPVYSYSPREIKQSVTGRGSATKSQIEYTVQSILKLQTPARSDAADGLACAICLFHKKRFELGGG